MYQMGLARQGATSGLTLKRRTTTVGRMDEEKAARKEKRKDEGRIWRRAKLAKGVTCLKVAIIP